MNLLRPACSMYQLWWQMMWKHRDGYISTEKVRDKTACSQTQPQLPRSPKEIGSCGWYCLEHWGFHCSLEVHSWAFIPSWPCLTSVCSRDSANVPTHSWGAKQPLCFWVLTRRLGEMKCNFTEYHPGGSDFRSACISFLNVPKPFLGKYIISPLFSKC